MLADAPPLPGEEARYAQVLAVLAAAKDNPKLKQAMIEAAKDAEEKLVNPLFQFRNYGQQLPHHWSTISNEAAFGTDYFTRTAVAKSNILVNSPNETKYFYQDLDASGARLNSANRYTVTFAKGRHASGEWLLVALDLQRAPFLCRQPDQPLLGRHQEQGSQIRRRRFAHDLRAGRCADGCGTARQLAASSERRFLPLRPRLLAEGGGHGWFMDAAARCSASVREDHERLRHLRLDRADHPGGMLVAVFCIAGWLPGHIAKTRNHPWAEAVTVAGWITLICGFALWPVALIWAYVDVPRPRAETRP